MHSVFRKSRHHSQWTWGTSFHGMLARPRRATHFLDQLEHLPELSPEELAELSQKVKNFDRRHF